MARIIQVEYMTRPDEREHIEKFDDFRKACGLVREISDKHDGNAVVVAIDPMPHDEPGEVATGHIEFVFGRVAEKVGSLSGVAVPP